MSGIAAVVVALLSASVAFAERLPLRHYASTDGLPHERVKRIVADSRGFIWFATPDGLGRFDGNRFVTWGRSDGLPHDSINDILEARDGVYWFATNGGGVARLDPPDQPRADGAVSPFVTATVGTSSASQRVNTLFEDREGTLWAGTDGGVFRREARRAPAAESFAPVTVGIAGIDDARLNVWCFAQDEIGRVWLGTSAGLLVRELDGRFEQLYVDAGAARESVWALYIDRSGRLWIGHDRAVVIVNPARADVRAIATMLARARPQTLDATASALPTQDGDAIRYTLTKDGVGVSVRSILEDDDGTVWVATLGLGLLGFERRGPRVWDDTHGLSDPRLLTLALDRSGNVWFGSFSRGAMRLARGGFTFFGAADGFVGRIARVSEDDAGALYVATDGGHLFRMNDDRPEPFGPIVVEAIPTAMGDFARAPVRDRQGSWWMPTPRGLMRFAPPDRGSLRTARPAATYTTANGLAAPSPYRLYEDARGDIWFGYIPAPAEQSVTRWERSTGTFHHYGPSDGLPARAIVDAFVEDATGALWIAYYDGPVARFRNGRFEVFTAGHGLPSSLHRWLHVDRRGRVWLGGSGGGLVRIDNPPSSPPTFKMFGAADGLSTNEVRGITDDGFGRIYVSTLRGIDRLDPDTNRVRRFTNVDGLLGAEFEVAYRDRLSRLWFSSPEGLARLVPQPDDTTRAATVLIGGVLNAGVPHPVHELGEADVEGVVLEPGQARLAISLIGLGGEGLQYQYRLDQGEWSTPASQDSVLLAGLSSGRYVFEARAVNLAGVAGERTARVRFRVLAPIWQRWWFLAALGLVIAGIAAVLHRMRVDRLLALERVRTRIATDLHDDIGASLSQIAILSEVARQQINGASPDVSTALERIAGTARETVDSMSDIVWAINPRRDALSDLTHRMRRFGNDTCSAADMRFVFEAPGDDDPLRLSADLRREIYLIFKEAVNNAVRHADCDAIDASLTIERQHLVLTVRDNGRGFRLEPSVDGNGVSSMHRRAGAVHGRLDVASAPAQGTVITLSAPIGRGMT